MSDFHYDQNDGADQNDVNSWSQDGVNPASRLPGQVGDTITYDRSPNSDSNNYLLLTGVGVALSQYGLQRMSFQGQGKVNLPGQNAYNGMTLTVLAQGQVFTNAAGDMKASNPANYAAAVGAINLGVIGGDGYGSGLHWTIQGLSRTTFTLYGDFTYSNPANQPYNGDDISTLAVVGNLTNNNCIVNSSYWNPSMGDIFVTGDLYISSDSTMGIGDVKIGGRCLLFSAMVGDGYGGYNYAAPSLGGECFGLVVTDGSNAAGSAPSFTGAKRSGSAYSPDGGSTLFYDTTAMNLPAANAVLASASGGPAGFGPNGATIGTVTLPAARDVRVRVAFGPGGATVGALTRPLRWRGR